MKMMQNGLLIWKWTDQPENKPWVLQKVVTATNIKTDISDEPPFDKMYFEDWRSAFTKVRELIGLANNREEVEQLLERNEKWVVSIRYNRGLGPQIKDVEVITSTRQIKKEAEKVAQQIVQDFADELKPFENGKEWEVQWRYVSSA
jgi:hypothetical protein